MVTVWSCPHVAAKITFSIEKTEAGNLKLFVDAVARLSGLRTTPLAQAFDAFESKIMWSNMAANMNLFLISGRKK